MSLGDTFHVAGLDVSRETLRALEGFEALVRRWTPAINLVSKSTLDALRERHTIDSAQLYCLKPEHAKRWVDIGSGGGFPGIVIAILARQFSPDLHVTLVESDARKATFLREASRTLGLSTTVLNERIESVPALSADVLSARALASLTDLLGFAHMHLRPEGVAIFPKGARYAEELTKAKEDWAFDVETHSSLSDSAAAILLIRNINRAHES